jgi:hypothetical protein
METGRTGRAQLKPDREFIFRKTALPFLRAGRRHQTTS